MRRGVVLNFTQFRADKACEIGNHNRTGGKPLTWLNFKCVLRTLNFATRLSRDRWFGNAVSASCSVLNPEML